MTPNKEEFKKTPKAHPLVSSMPAHLKDPANYNKIQRVILDSLASGHSHGEIMEWASCGACQRRFYERGQVLERLGFKSPAQYMIWKQIHAKIKERYPLAKYNS